MKLNRRTAEVGYASTHEDISPSERKTFNLESCPVELYSFGLTVESPLHLLVLAGGESSPSAASLDGSLSSGLEPGSEM